MQGQDMEQPGVMHSSDPQTLLPPLHPDQQLLPPLHPDQQLLHPDLQGPQWAGHIVSVHEACEEIWRCQQLDKAASWLQLLHHAILRDPLDTFDPSEAFLCLQGAALRFHAQSQQPESEEHNEESGDGDSPIIASEASIVNEEESVWNVWEEAMWAAAALARVCVGPAWRLQLQQRKSYLSSSLPQTEQSQHEANDSASTGIDAPSVVVTDNHSPRSYSPMTASSFGNASRRLPTDVWYPPIPEVLPAAMLRFGASAIGVTIKQMRRPDSTFSKWPLSKEDLLEQVEKEQKWLTRRIRLAEAQRELVLALCCTTSEEPFDPGGKRGEWSIPGAHDPVASMLLFWLETATTGWPFIKPEKGVIHGIRDEEDGSEDVSEDGSEESRLGVPTEDSNKLSTSDTNKSDDHGRRDKSTLQSHDPPLPLTTGKNVNIKNGDTTADRPPSLTGSMHVEPEDRHVPSIDFSGSLPTSLSSPNDCHIEVVMWSDVVDTGALDWWYALQVTRAVTDLVSAGWRPPPRSDIGAEAVLCLLQIAEKGMILRSTDVKCEPEATDREAREERLAAASSAAEAVSSLASLGSRGLIPNSTQSHTVTVLSRLQAAATMPETVASPLYPLGDATSAEEEEELDLEKETFMTQRESCFADTADLLWVLLAHQASAITSATTLMRLVDLDLSWKGSSTSSSFSEQSKYINNAEMTAAAAVRVLGKALWGNINESRGVSSLRIFWLPCLDLFCKVVARIHQTSTKKMPIMRNSTDCSSVSSERNATYVQVLSHCNTLSLEVAHEIVVAFARLVHAELATGEAMLAPNEWDAFVLNLDNCIMPWLTYETTSDFDAAGTHDETLLEKQRIYRQILLALYSLLFHVGDFLDKCSESESSPVHAILDDTCRRQLYLLLIRKAVPYMQLEQASPLALAVIRSWSASGFVPSRSAEWCQTASDILSNAFAIYDEVEYGFIGGYVYSPVVRLEAIMAITNECAQIDDDFSITQNAESASLQDDQKQFTAASPLCLLGNSREQQVELIGTVILPLLILVLGTNIENSLEDFRKTVHPTRANRHRTFGKHDPKLFEDEKVEEDELALRVYIVKLLGRLFRYDSLDKYLRSLLVKILLSVALGECTKIVSSSAKTGLMDQNEIVTLEAFSSDFHLSLEAIRQIELCLCAPFGSLPYAHNIIPFIIECLCLILTYHAANDSMKKLEASILAMGALLPLCRLSISHDRHLLLLEKSEVANHVPIELVNALQINDDDQSEPLSSEDDGMHDAVAPFVIVDTEEINRRNSNSVGFDGDQSRASKQSRISNESSKNTETESTAVFFDPIVEAIVFALKSSRYSTINPDTDSKSEFSVHMQEVFARMRSTCLDALRSLILSGVSVPLKGDIAAATSLPLEARGVYANAEKVSRCRAIAALAEYIAARSCLSNSLSRKKQPPDAGVSLLSELLQLCISDDDSEIAIGCQAMGVVLPSLVVGDNVLTGGRQDWIPSICSALISRLRTLLTTQKVEEDNQVDNTGAPETAKGVDVASALLSVLCDLFSGDKYAMHSGLEDYRLETLTLCQDICLSKSEGAKLSWYTRLLALSCAASSIRGMELDEIKKAFERANSSKYWSWSPGSDKSALGVAFPEQGDDWERLRGLVYDVLFQRHGELIESGHKIHMNNELYRNSTHECYAKETDEIEQFLVESDEKYDQPTTAVWLFHDSIISCRLGSSASRFCGWMEVIVRSPSARKRRMVRLPNHISIENPELPSSLWEEPSSKQVVLSEEEKSEMNLPESSRNRTSLSSAMTKALSVMERFDKSVARLEIALENTPKVQNCDILSDLSFSQAKHPTMPIATRSSSSTMRQPSGSSIAHSLSSTTIDDCEVDAKIARLFEREDKIREETGHGADDEVLFDASEISVHDPSSSSQPWSPESDEECIRNWLTFLFKDSDNVNAVESQLRDLGFSESMLVLNGSSRDDDPLIRRLQAGPRLQRALNILDRTATLQTHKMALLFAGPASASHLEADNEIDMSFEDLILKATQGSKAFLDFTSEISHMSLTRHLKYFSGGLDTSTYMADGVYAATWLEEGQFSAFKKFCVFHLVTLMPDGLNNRKRHVGNDNIHIVYVEQGYAFQPEIDRWGYAGDLQSAVVSGEFGFVTIFVMLLTQVDLVRVTVRIRAGLPEVAKAALRHLTGSCVVAKAMAPHYVRRVAIRADLACRSAMEDRLGLASNWEDRRQQIFEMERYCS